MGCPGAIANQCMQRLSHSMVSVHESLVFRISDRARALYQGRQSVVSAHLRLGDAPLGAVHEGRDGHLQLLLIVPLSEQLLLQAPHPLLVHPPRGCQVP